MTTTARTTARTARRRTTDSAVGAPFQLVNPGTVTMTYDGEGRQVEPGKRVTVSQVDRVGRKAVQRKYLLCQDNDGTWVTFDDDGNPVPRPVDADDDVASPSEPDVSTGRPDGGASDPE